MHLAARLGRTGVLAMAAMSIWSCSKSHSGDSSDRTACNRAADVTKALNRFLQNDDIADLEAMATALNAAIKAAHDPDLIHALNLELAAVQQAKASEADDMHADTSTLIIADGEVGNLCSQILTSDIVAP